VKRAKLKLEEAAVGSPIPLARRFLSNEPPGRFAMRNRREFLSTAASAVALAAIAPALVGPAAAQAIDTLKIFVPAAPGGGWDQTGRSIEMAMKAEGLAKSFQFEHVPGAGGTVGLPRFIGRRGQANSLMVGGMVMVGASIANKSPVNLTQVTPIARLTGEAEVVVVPAASPHKTMKDLVAALKKDPGAVSWAGGSAGGTDHILVGLVARAAGVDPKKISYVAYAGGGPATAAILGNQVTAGVSGWEEFAEQVKAGKMRALAISSDKRIAGIDVPTLKEQGIDVELFNWRGVFAPPGISDAHQKQLVDAVTKMNNSKTWQDELKKRNWVGILMTGDAFGGYIRSETDRIHGMLKTLGLAT
jgi:putative tricarboxylic transport membrane protein